MAFNLSPLMWYAGTKEGKRASKKAKADLKKIERSNQKLMKSIAKNISKMTPKKQKDVLGALSGKIGKDIKKMLKVKQGETKIESIKK